MKTFGPPWVAWAVIYIFVGGLTVLAENNDDMDTKKKSDDAETQTEFAFNIFSDIAPILALFGEQFATQYLSQSYTWLDHIVFACVPLGIVTALSAAIRVQGSAWMRSFIGRARENRATAEIELMSSTSGEVCEIFNGKAIVRTMGRPKIAQIILFPDEESKSDVSRGIYTLKAAVSEQEERKPTKMTCEVYRSRWHEFMIPKRRRSVDAESKYESDKVWKESLDFLGPPNVQVNVASGHSSKESNKAELFFAMSFAIIIQLGVIVIACVTVAYEPTRRAIGFQPESYGLPSYVTGSFAIFVSMLICSHAIERSTFEHIWQRSRQTSNSDSSSKEDSLMRLFWIQRAQTVSDQTFGSYIILGGAKRYILTSSRKELVEAEKEPGSISESESDSAGNKSNSDAKRLRWEATTFAGVALGATGFVAQFIGLRGLSYPVSISHLGAIIVMALVRALIRRRLGQVPLCFPALEGRELDCLAYQLTVNKELRDFTDVSKRSSVTAEIDSIRQWEVLTPKMPDVAKTRGQSPTSTSSQVEIHQKVGDTDKEENLPQDENLFYAPIVSKDGGLHAIDDSKTEARSQELIRIRKRLGDLCQWRSHETEVALALAQGIESFLHAFVPNGPPRLKNSDNSVNWRIRCANPFIENGSRGTTGDTTDCINVPIRFTESTSMWEIEIGQLEAILSLWMASIEAARMMRHGDSASRQKGQKSDWRRGVRSKTRYRRNLGLDFDDGILMRDISWWISHDVARSSKNDPSVPKGDLDLVIGFSGPEHEEYKIRTQSKGELAIFSSDHLPNILAQHLLTSFMWTIVNLIPENSLRGTDSADENEAEAHALAQFTEQTTSADQASYPCKLTHSKLTRVVTSMESTGLATANDLLLCMIPALSWRDLLPNERMLGLIPSPSDETQWDRTLKCYANILKTSICNGELRRQCLACAVVVKAMDFIFIAYDKSKGDSPFHQMLKYRMRNLMGCILQHGQEILRTLAPIYSLQRRWVTFTNIFGEYQKNDLGLFTEYSLSNLDSRRLMGELPVLGFSESHQEIFRIIWARSSEKWTDKVPKSFEVGGPDHGVEPDLFGWIPLHYAILHSATAERRGDDFLRQLVVAIRENNHAWDHRSSRRLCDGPGLVHLAAQAGSAIIIYELMAAKLKPDSLDSLGHLPFSYVETERDRESIQVVDDLLKDWKNVDLQDERGRTCLHWAVEIAAEDSIKRFLKKKNTYRVLEATDHMGNTPLHIASQRGHPGILDVLLINSAQVNATNHNRQTPLHIASRSGHIGTLDLLLTNNARVDAADHTRKTPLHIASQNGHLDILKALLKKHARVDTTDNTGKTPLHIASQMGHVDVLYALLSEGAGVDIADHTGRTAIHYAACDEVEGTLRIMRSLFHKGANMELQDTSAHTPLHISILEGKEKAALWLIDHFNANTGARDNDGVTPLMMACRAGLKPIVQRIATLEKPHDGSEWGNSVVSHSNAGFSTQQHKLQGLPGQSTANEQARNPFEDKDNTGRCCLHYASASDHDILPTILDSKVPFDIDINACDEAGTTPLLHAIRKQKQHNALSLLKSQADPTIGDNSGRLPFFEAVNNNWPDVVDCMVNNDDSFVNIVDGRSGRSALSQACHLGFDEIVRKLLKCPEIDVNIPKGANSPLHSSIHARNLEIAQVLLQHPEIDVTAANDSEERLLDVSLSRGSWKLVAQLLENETMKSDGIGLLDQFLSMSPKDNGAELHVLLSAMACQFSLADVKKELRRSDSFLEPGSCASILDRILEREDASVSSLRDFLLDAVRCGHKTGVEALTRKKVEPFQLDDDNWSCLRIAEEYGHDEILGCLQEYVAGLTPPETYTRAQPLPPADLKLPEGLGREWIKISRAQGDRISASREARDSDFIFDVRIQVTEDEIRESVPEMIDHSARTIRSRNCVPPDADNYYFEVEIVSGSRYFAVGFCHDLNPGSFDKTLGEYPGSFSVKTHGFLSLDGKWRAIPDPLSGSNDTFDDGDIVGAGVNMKTGDVYWTRNGVLLNTGETGEISFRNLGRRLVGKSMGETNLPSIWASPPDKTPIRMNLKTGKLYPAIGVSFSDDHHAHAKVMLRQSSHRTFRYKGPYDYEY